MASDNGNIYCAGYSGHDGIDYGLSYKYVRASHAGTVYKAGWDNPNHHLDFGLVVRLRTTSGNTLYETVYGHLSAILVTTNTPVVQGKVIAVSGTTGNSSGPHLHFSVRRPVNNSNSGTLYPVNPYGWQGTTGQDPWQLQGRPASVNLWIPNSYPSIKFYSNCTQLPYPDGPEITAPNDPPLQPPTILPPAPFTTIIDDSFGSPRFATYGSTWQQTTCPAGASCNGTTYRTAPLNLINPETIYATFIPNPDELIPGLYDVYAFNPSVLADSNASLATYYIHHNNQTHFAGFDQDDFNKPAGQRPWSYLGRYDFAGGGLTTYQERIVVYHEGTGNEKLSADAVVFILVDGPANIIKEITVDSDDAGMDPIPCTNGASNTGLTRPEIYMGYCNNGGSLISGWHFRTVNIPIGAVIKKAHIQFTVDGPYTIPLHVLFYGDKVANSPPFSTSNMPNNRSLLTSSVAWDVPSTAPWTVYEYRYSPNLAPVIQQIVNLNGWSPGNSLTFVVKPNTQYPAPTSATKYRRVMAYDRTPNGTLDARLFIWLACSGPSCPTQ